MLFLLISILCSVTVGVFFKKIKLNVNEIFLIITINYLVAFVLSLIFFDFEYKNEAFNYFLIIPLIVLMPLVFYIFNLSINKSGIIKTDISQRLSLIIPIASAFLIFGEQISWLKWIGILLGLFSVILMLYRTNNNKNTKSTYLFLVFFGYGIIDVLFKQIALKKNVAYINYLILIFAGCFLFSLVIIFFRKKTSNLLSLKNIFWGLFLGILNFSNIFFYLKAHQVFSKDPSTVFAIMNFGVISIATVLGVFIFKEKLSKRNIIGIIVAIIAISCILIATYK